MAINIYCMIQTAAGRRSVFGKLLRQLVKYFFTTEDAEDTEKTPKLTIKWPFSVSSASSVVIKNCDAPDSRFSVDNKPTQG
jgi:hypothetical protein